VFIVFFNPRTIGAGTHGGDPLGIVQIPANRVAQTFVKAHGLLPAELVFELGAVYGVAPVVAGPVFDVGDERIELPHGLAGLLGDDVDKPVKEPDVFPLVLAADVVGLSDTSARHDSPHRSVVVYHVEPVANVLAIAIDREGFVFQHVENHKRDELFRKLIGPVVVRAIRDGHGKAVGVAICFDQEVAGRLAGGIGRARVVGCGLLKRAFLAEAAIHFVRRNVVEKHTRASALTRCTGQCGRIIAILALPCLPRSFQKRVGAHHIRRDKGLRIKNRAVHMAFRCKVHHRVDGVVRKELLHKRRIANVAMDEYVAILVLHSDIGKVLRVASIGERIEIDNPTAKPSIGEEVANKVRADKPCSASHQDIGKRSHLGNSPLQSL